MFARLRLTHEGFRLFNSLILQESAIRGNIRRSGMCASVTAKNASVMADVVALLLAILMICRMHIPDSPD